jgi:3-phenylpropionate/trans-cinnamate dioxygenase ferredoxin reductase component
LLGQVTEDDVMLRGSEAVDAIWHLADAATGLDLPSRTVRLASGTVLGYDALLIATGVRARWPTGLAPGPRILALRTLSDALALRRALPACRRLIVLGAGFIGCEVAASARASGADVTLVDHAPAPLTCVLGGDIARRLVGLHASHGVAMHFGVGLAELHAGECLSGVRLSDGTEIDGDLIVVGTGAEPCTEWLRDVGIAIYDGVVCDQTLRVRGAAGADPGPVWAAGDVARRPHPAMAGRDIRVEHWTNAALSGLAAARNMLNPAAPVPFTALPEFWSDQYGVGYPGEDCDVRIEEGSLASGQFLASYHRAGQLAGAVAFNATRALAAWRSRIASPAASAGQA